MMEHKCSCCQEVQTSIRKVTLMCSDGTHLDHSYTYVEQCSCVGAECVPQDIVNQQQQTGNIWGKDLSRKRKCLKLELKRSQTRVEHRLKQTFGKKKKVTKAAKILDKQTIFSAYKLNISVYIISVFITIVSHTGFHVFSLTSWEVQCKIILTFVASLYVFWKALYHKTESLHLHNVNILFWLDAFLWSHN